MKSFFVIISLFLCIVCFADIDADLLKRAEQGDPDAQLNLAMTYAEKNEGEAFKWYLKSAENGNSEAQYTVGIKYIEEKNIPLDYQEGIKWFLKAAKQGHNGAQLAVAGMYFEGKGVPQDIIQAYAWAKIANDNGLAQASLAMRDAEGQMTKTQVEKAQELANTLFPKESITQEENITRSCFTDQKLISGAYEMYNMDNVEMKQALNPADFKTGGILVEGHYLKTEINPNAGCEYYSAGDLTGNGKISCRLHGCP